MNLDVIDRCSRCYGPIFNGSQNAMPDGYKMRVKPDFTDAPKLRHKRCPQRGEKS